MIYRVLVDGQEHIISKQIRVHSRSADNKAREEIINLFLDEKKARKVQIVEAYDEETGTITSLLS